MTDSVEITRLAHGGKGVGRIERKVVFVPYGVPGDVVRLEAIADKGSYAEATVAEVLTPSPHRVAWECPVFGSCGGCCWLHIAPDVQREWKAHILADSLTRIGHVEPPPIRHAEPPSAPEGYRTRARLQAAWTAEGYHVGFFAERSRRVVDVERCPLLAHGLNNILADIRRALVVPGPPSGLKRVDVTYSRDAASASVILTVPQSQRKHFDEITAWLTERPGISAARFSSQKGTRGAVHFHVAGFEYRVSPHSFFQANSTAAETLVRTVVELADPRRDQTIVDLYCGVGLLTLPLARRAEKVIGVEGNADAVADARANVRNNGVSRAEVHGGDVATALTDLGIDTADTVVLDPPRDGAKAAIRAIAALRPDRIVYVSCDPATLARDAAALGKRGYRPVESVVVDMFPGTAHVESVTRFSLEPE